MTTAVGTRPPDPEVVACGSECRPANPPGRLHRSTARTPSVSVVVSTYNRPRALDAVLHALCDQRHPDVEIVVADDGSGEATAALIRDHPLRRRRAVQHVWQADEGFRAAEIRNKAILKAAGEYIVFLDGDCVPRPDFVSRHAALAEPGRFVTGHRVLMSRAATEQALANRTRLHRLAFRHWIGLRLSGRINHLAPFVSLPDAAWRRLRKTRWKGAVTCNLGVWRRDLNTVNGFDERYRGWGLEDSDLVIRLINAGIYRKEGRYATGVIHLWHAEQDRSRLGDNRDRLQRVLASGATRAVAGLARRSSTGQESAP